MRVCTGSGIAGVQHMVKHSHLFGFFFSSLNHIVGFATTFYLVQWYGGVGRFRV
jgi:hypothetical protein